MPRPAHAFMAILFLFGAIVQYNDPDPFRWMAIYLGASIACALAALRRGHWAFAAVVGVVALTWGGSLAPAVLGVVEPGALVGAWEMKDTEIEVGREMYGLFIIAAWMFVVVVTERRRQRSSRSAGPLQENGAEARRAPTRAGRG